MLSSKTFDVKITDFGFSLPVEGRQGNMYLKSRVGCLGYMAPEVINTSKEGYTGRLVDIFSLGMILARLHLKNFLVKMAAPGDKFYQCFMNNKADDFWRVQEKYSQT